MPASAGVKRGKLYPVQGQIGGRNPTGNRRGRGALPSPRVGRMSRRATGGPRWMAIRDGASRRDRTRLTDGLADASARDHAQQPPASPARIESTADTGRMASYTVNKK